MNFEVKVEFSNFLNPSNPGNYGPGPVSSYNPVIQGIEVVYDGASSVDDWLFDTGAQVSMISGEQGNRLGLTEPNGLAIVEPLYYVDLGGIGGGGGFPAYQVDSLTIPTLQGFDLVYVNAFVLVANIEYIDERTGQQVTLGGVLGTNLLDLCYDPNLEIIAEGVYDNIVFDTQRAVLGFDVKDIYSALVPTPLPDQCGDANHAWLSSDINCDCVVDLQDISSGADNCLMDDCDWLNWNCSGTDVNRDGLVDIADVAQLAAHWLEQT